MKCILVIDDDIDIREMLQRMLTIEGYKVLIASDGVEGVALHKENPVDLIITDIIMPNKEGISVIQDLKLKTPDLKIIAISGGGRVSPANWLELAEAFGADHTLVKPFERKQILNAVEKLLEN